MAADFDAFSNQKRGRTRSPGYPYIALPSALEKAAVLWQVEGKHAAAVNVAMQHWGYKEDSSTGYSCVAALKKFGLVDHEGMGDTRQVKLSDLALTILLDQDPASDARRAALRAAALGPRIHAELWDRYGTELPSDQSLKRYLVNDRAFNEASVDEFLDEYKQTMAFAGMGVGTGAAGAPEGLPGRSVNAPANVAPGPGPGNGGPAMTERRQDPPPGPSRPAPRPADGREGGRRTETRFPAVPASLVPARAEGDGSSRQRGLFDGDDPGPGPEIRDAVLPARERRADADREGGAPWSMARKELPVPLDHDLVARVPYPMSEEDFELLIGTLQLWKKRLVQSGA